MSVYIKGDQIVGADHCQNFKILKKLDFLKNCLFSGVNVFI